MTMNDAILSVIEEYPNIEQENPHYILIRTLDKVISDFCTEEKATIDYDEFQWKIPTNIISKECLIEILADDSETDTQYGIMEILIENCEDPNEEICIHLTKENGNFVISGFYGSTDYRDLVKGVMLSF